MVSEFGRSAWRRLILLRNLGGHPERAISQLPSSLTPLCLATSATAALAICQARKFTMLDGLA